MGNTLLGACGGAVLGGTTARLFGCITEDTTKSAIILARGGTIGGSIVGGPSAAIISGMMREHAAEYGECRDEVDELTKSKQQEL